MDILEWIKKNRPGKIEQLDDRIEISHDAGDYSTVWLNTQYVIGENTKKIDDLYHLYDGMDLFSSTFKVASLEAPKSKHNVVLVQNLIQIAEDLKTLRPEFPEESVPFMYQAGIGFYAVGIKSGKVYEWDEEENELSDEYESVQEIFDEWLKAMA